jgi:hypothetical protein
LEGEGKWRQEVVCEMVVVGRIAAGVFDVCV